MAFAPSQGSGKATGAAATQVQGTANDGAAELGNPVQVGGVDGAGNAQALSVDTSGRADVNLVSGQSAITAGAGVVAANTPRVTHASDDPAVVALQLIDNWDESSRAKVNPIVGQAGVAAGAGAVGVTVQRTTLASDDPAVAALQIIDDWDETNRAAVNLVVGQAGVTAGAGAVAANTPRATLASDDPAVAALGATTGAKVVSDANGTLQQYLRGIATMLCVPATADVNLAIVADVDAAVGAAAGLRLVGFSCRETAGASAEFKIVNGATGAGGTLIIPVKLIANESTSDWFGPFGVDAVNGISVDWVSGTVDIVLYHRTV